MKKCSRCKGRGMREVGNDLVSCRQCKGTGKVMDAREMNVELQKKADDLAKAQQIVDAKINRPMRALAKAAQPAKTPPSHPCKHQGLHFEDGGLHVICDKCGQAWQAVQKNRLTPDFTARTRGLSQLDSRRDPFAT